MDTVRRKSFAEWDVDMSVADLWRNKDRPRKSKELSRPLVKICFFFIFEFEIMLKFLLLFCY